MRNLTQTIAELADLRKAPPAPELSELERAGMRLPDLTEATARALLKPGAEG